MKQPSPDSGFLFASGPTVPAVTTRGYATGCIFQHTDGSAGNALYVNEGDATSCLFALIGANIDGDVFIDKTGTLRIGDWVGSGATTGGVPLTNDYDTYDDGQIDILQVHGVSTTSVGSGHSAKCGRFRHLVNMSGTIETETYGLIGQLVVKTAKLGHWHSGLIGTIESSTSFSVGNTLAGAAAVIGRPGGSGITVDTGCILAALAALDNTTSMTKTGTGKYVGLLVMAASSGTHSKFTEGIYINPGDVVKGIVIGAEEFVTAGDGIVVNGVSLHSGCEFYFDDGGVKLAAGYTEAFRCGYLVSTAITTADVSLYTAHDYVYLAANVTTAGGVGATWASLLLKTGVTITTSSGLCDFSAFNASVDVPSGATIGTGTWACGLAIGGNLGGTHTGKAAGIRLRVPSAGKWDVGLRIEPTSCVEAIQIGEGKYASSDYGYGIPLDGVTQHSGIEIYFDDGGVKLAAGYTEAVMQGFLVTQAITTADVSLYTAHDYVYLAANVTTAGGVGAAWASLLVKTGVTITTSSGLCDFSAFNASVDIPSGAVIGTATFACGLSIGGNMGGTHTGSAVGFRLRAGYNGSWDGLCDITSQVTAETVDAAEDVAGSIKIYIDGVAKYLHYWPNVAA